MIVTSLHEIIRNSATAGLSLLDDDTGSMPSGHNGPYNDTETPVRNTCHWSILFAKSYKIDGNFSFRIALEKISDYLKSEEIRPNGYTFWHRSNPNKNYCNSLIGQAWTIEALVTIADVLEQPELVKLAEKVFLMHPFDRQLGLWKQVEIDGRILGFDITFNHQLWFAAIGSTLAQYGNEKIQLQIDSFIKKLPNLISIYSSGLICHLFTPRVLWLSDMKDALRHAYRYTWSKRNFLHYKAIGYHAFNLYALALLKEYYKNDLIWKNKKIQQILNYTKSSSYWQSLDNNQYAYPYNPPGIEVAYFLEKFLPDSQDVQRNCLIKQFKNTYDLETNMMNKSTNDPHTYAARLYEATRLPNLELNLGNHF